ncbi:MAG: hypothetical protein J5710_04060 [Treponema sp.]|nr:hypothetical protein [Treponema sp.]
MNKNHTKSKKNFSCANNGFQIIDKSLLKRLFSYKNPQKTFFCVKNLLPKHGQVSFGSNNFTQETTIRFSYVKNLLPKLSQPSFGETFFTQEQIQDFLCVKKLPPKHRQVSFGNNNFTQESTIRFLCVKTYRQRTDNPYLEDPFLYKNSLHIVLPKNATSYKNSTKKI